LWNAVLTVIKLAAAVISGSKAMLADALESASDIIVTFAVLLSLRVADKPRDADHPYGHGKVESLVSQVIGGVLFVAGFAILWIAIQGIMDPPEEAPGVIAFWVALGTIGVKEILFRFTIKVGRKSGSPVVEANAWGHRSDAYSSIVTVVGIGGALAGAPILDPVAAALVSLFIFRMGFNILRKSTYELMDGAPDIELLERATSLAESVDGVVHAHRIRGRRTGRGIWLDLTVDMDSQMSIEKGHAIAHKAKQLIMNEMAEVEDVMIHVNPHQHPHSHDHEF